MPDRPPDEAKDPPAIGRGTAADRAGQITYCVAAAAVVGRTFFQPGYDPQGSVEIRDKGHRAKTRYHLYAGVA